MTNEQAERLATVARRLAEATKAMEELVRAANDKSYIEAVKAMSQPLFDERDIRAGDVVQFADDAAVYWVAAVVAHTLRCLSINYAAGTTWHARLSSVTAYRHPESIGWIKR